MVISSFLSVFVIKVIIQIRDPETWFISFQNLMKEACFSYWGAFCIWPLPGIYALHRLMKPRLVWWHDTYNYPKAGKQIMAFYINKIKSSIPPERIMVFKVQDGWTPLCRFLSKPIPDIDFPTLNEVESLIDMHKKWKRQGLQSWKRRLLQTFVIATILSATISIYWKGPWLPHNVSGA